MKKIIFLLLIAGAAGCNVRSDNDNMDNESTLNTEESVDENSGENISPQLEDSANRFKVDSISTANDNDQEKKKDLEDGESSQ